MGDGLEARLVERLATLGVHSQVGLIAVSGGPDSLALLHLLAATVDEHSLKLVVGHVDHGIHPESASVAAAVASEAARLGLPFETTRLELGQDAGETEARTARYRWLGGALARLRDAMHSDGVILTAHHRDDQIETILMRVLKGSGPAGLSGIPGAHGAVVRPLLDVPRLELEEYLSEIGVTAWSDPSNRSDRQLRGWIRHAVLPELREKLPGVESALLSLGNQARAAKEAWDLVLHQLPLDIESEGEGLSFASAPLRAYDRGLAEALFMALARRIGLTVGPSRGSRALDVVLWGGSGSRADLGQGWFAEVRFDRIAVVRAPVAMAEADITESAGEFRSGRWRIRWCRNPNPGEITRFGWTTWLPLGTYRVRGWRAGDRIRPWKGAGSRLVVRCMQELEVGRSERPTWPIVSAGDDIIWVPGVCRSALAIPTPGQPGGVLRVDVERE